METLRSHLVEKHSEELTAATDKHAREQGVLNGKMELLEDAATDTRAHIRDLSESLTTTRNKLSATEKTLHEKCEEMETTVARMKQDHQQSTHQLRAEHEQVTVSFKLPPAYT